MRGFKPVILSVVILVLVAVGLVSYAGRGSRKPAPAAEDRTAPKPESPPPAKSANPQVVMTTSLGTLTLELDPERTPATAANFLKYVDEKFYDGLIFHRVIQTFMIQGGGFTPDSQPKPATHGPVVNESRNGGRNVRGTIAMARTEHVDSATCQFFINTVDNPGLDYPNRGGYTVFGRVVEGLDVVDRIAAVPVRPDGISGPQPIENVLITDVRRR
ncbi:MAG: peptidylprolyl isomerase [Planctomycetes bacterium]|nr:peptidylprolyl isomerase [Planctomycetota bacterium]